MCNAVQKGDLDPSRKLRNSRYRETTSFPRGRGAGVWPAKGGSVLGSGVGDRKSNLQQLTADGRTAAEFLAGTLVIVAPAINFFERLPYSGLNKYNQKYFLTYKEKIVSKLRFDEDIRPLSDVRAGIASFVKQVNETGRPVVLTQRGRGVAVLVGVHEYQGMQERLELLEDVHLAEAQLKAGKGIPHGKAKETILKALRK